MKRYLILALLMIVCNASFAQKSKEAALEHFKNEKWEDAIKEYKKFLKKNEGDSLDWYNLANSHFQLEQYDEAITNYRQALDRKYPAGFIYFGIAKSYALMKDQDKLLEVLNEGAENNFRALFILKTDSAFAPYQEVEEFKTVLQKIKLNAFPCLSREEYRHFDFWLGEWDVYVGETKVGVNNITMATGGCAIHESYISVRNYEGQSINFWDPIDKKWHQHWVGSAGDTYNYLEVDRGPGMLQFQSDFMGPQGNISLSRLTFTLNEDGTVRQLFESSTDEGKTWSPAFDGLYKRKEP